MIYIIVIALFLGIEWLAVCGIIKLICLCLGLTFTWGFATAVWLVFGLLSFFYNFLKEVMTK